MLKEHGIMYFDMNWMMYGSLAHMEFIIKEYRCSVLQSFSKYPFSTFPALAHSHQDFHPQWSAPLHPSPKPGNLAPLHSTWPSALSGSPAEGNLL